MEGSGFLLFFITLLPLESNFCILAALFLLTFPQNVKQQERGPESNLRIKTKWNNILHMTRHNKETEATKIVY